MPTPSAPNPGPPYSFNSTCPDTDEQQMPQSPSSWHPPPPPPYATEMDADTPEDSVQHSVTTEDDGASRSETMSPIPLSTTDSSDGPIPDTDLMSPTSPTEHGEQEGEEQKQSETDDERMESADDTRPDERLSTARRRQVPRRDDPPVAVNKSGAAAMLNRQHGWNGDVDMPMMGSGSTTRIIPQSPSSFLRPGSKFRGTQQSERQVYEVQVEIKHVDLRESFLCGYLRIQGLTEDHPTLTTYFEGEIIGSKYGFMTKHEDWGATDKIDYSHWHKFPAFKPIKKLVKDGVGAPGIIKEVAQNEHIFMRWKEHFLVPDHRVRTINGASFEGFYYICFNQIQGEISGIYFHSKSERFQQLDLKHIEDRGCFSAMEFR